MAPCLHNRNIHDRRLADAWATLQAHSNEGLPLDPDATRLAFADPEFLLRRETRGIRFQLELLKPDLEQQAHGIENTIVVFGSARFRSEEESAALVAAAEGSRRRSADPARPAPLARNAHYYEKARAFGKLVAQYSAGKDPQDKLFICTGGGPGIMQARQPRRPRGRRHQRGPVDRLADGGRAPTPTSRPRCPSSSTTSRCARCIS